MCVPGGCIRLKSGAPKADNCCRISAPLTSGEQPVGTGPAVKALAIDGLNSVGAFLPAEEADDHYSRS